MIDTANDDDFQSKVNGALGVVVVDFTAAHCGPCREQARVLQRFVAKHPDVAVVEVDVEHAPRTTVAYGVRATPTLLVFVDGALTRTAVGLQTDARVARLVAGD